MRKILQSDILRCILSGLLLVLAWPPISFTPLLFVAFIPLMSVIGREFAIRKIWGYSYITFFVWTLGTMYWIGNTELNPQGFLIIVIAWTLIPLFQSLPILIFGWIKKTANGYLSWFTLPFLWVSYEYLHSKWQLAFTWLHLGFGLSPMPWLMQFYEFTGYLGGSFFIVLVNVLLFLLVKEQRRSHYRGLVCATGAIVFIVIISNMLLYPQPGTNRGARIKAAVIQSNADPYEELDENSLRQQVVTLHKLLLPIKKGDVDLVVLSEGFLRTSPMAPLILNNVDEQPAVKEIKKISRRIDAPILVGFIGFKLFDDQRLAPSSALPIGDGRYFSGYNGAMLVAHDTITQIQLKNNLVPFMERVPYLDQISFLENFKLRLNQTRKSYEKDGIAKVFHYKNMRIGTLICLDALFPEYAGEFVNNQANVFAVIANDSWAGNTSGYLQNAQYASTIAISFRRNVIRCATTGQSMFVDRWGTKSKTTLWNEQKTAINEVLLSNVDTSYASMKHWPGIICVVLSVGFVLYVFTSRRKKIDVGRPVNNLIV